VSTTSHQHFAKNVFFGCIDDRLVEPHLRFIIEIGGAFYPAVAGGGLAFVCDDYDTALKQVVASYKINQVDNVYLESHTDCGAYGLSGAVFHSETEELDRLYADLDQASEHIRAALLEAGAQPGEVKIHVRVVDTQGVLQPRPQHAHQS
jgi:carbonic anhydrase